MQVIGALILQMKQKNSDYVILDLYKEDLFHPVVSNCLGRLLTMSDIRVSGILLDGDPFVI